MSVTCDDIFLQVRALANGLGSDESSARVKLMQTTSGPLVLSDEGKVKLIVTADLLTATVKIGTENIQENTHEWLEEIAFVLFKRHLSVHTGALGLSLLSIDTTTVREVVSSENTLNYSNSLVISYFMCGATPAL